jgi:hypothetical protein
VPEPKDGGWSRNPIDKFIYSKLGSEGLSPAPEAGKAILARRVYFDLLGLPPTAEQIEHFVADPSSKAYDRLIEELLRQPRYGEKWARHWLDLVRYAESDGFKSDTFRPHAWRYRDYVIRSFNQDKPYNLFLMEQIAADELWPADPERMVALNFLRLPIYEYNQRNVKGQWATIINDITDVTGDALLGLGLQCARCHDHKFDPISQRDYYRLQAFFAPLWPRDDLPLATARELKEYEAQLDRWKTITAEVRSQIEALEGPVREQVAKGVIAKFPRDIQNIMAKPAGERTPYEQQIHVLAYRQVLDEFEKLDGKFQGKDKEKLDLLRKALSEFDLYKPNPLPEAMLVTDIGPVAPPVTIPKDKSQTPIEPGWLSLLEEAPLKIESSLRADSTGRRAALANWLAASDNRFTSRVMVNRIWQQHFGRGLVGTPNDFGHLGEPPSHPELLDWLARYFVEHNWSVKEIHRLILTSATYRQSILHPPSPVGETVAADAALKSAEMVDPGNRWLWRQNLRRLESDQIRDAMLWATGELDLESGGPSVEPSRPRRTIFTKWLRNSRDPLLEAFDPPDAYTSTPQRNVTTTPMQSLIMVNGPYVLQRAQALCQRIEALHPTNHTAEVIAAYQFIYGRAPTARELSNAASFLQQQAERIAQSKIMAQPATAPFPNHPGTAALFEPEGRQKFLFVPDNHLLPQYDFTLETCVVLRSVDPGSELRTIVSRWDGRKDQPGWSLSVAGLKSSLPRSLVLELIGDAAEDGSGGYEAIRSSFQLELDQPYYVAVSVRIGDTSQTGVTFYLKPLSGDHPLRSERAAHKVTANHQSNLPIIIGCRDQDKHQPWDGLIDDLRLARRALKPEELWVARPAADQSIVGYWRFESPKFFQDSSAYGHHIRPEIAPTAGTDPQTAALIDFCHVLLNSSEFIYVE